MAAWRALRAWALMLIVTGIGLATDLASKAIAFQRIAGIPVTIDREAVLNASRLDMLIPTHKPVVVVPGLLEFTLVLNPGAVFGVGAGKRWFFVIFTVLALGFAAWIFGVWTRARDRLAHVAIGLIAAGGLGNLYDRLRFACVRDFIHPLPGLELPFGLAWPGGAREVWPYVSNVADLYLIVGIGILLLLNFRRSNHDEAKQQTEKSPPDQDETMPEAR